MLPKQWSDITLEQFMEISTVEKTLGSSHYNCEILSIITDVSIDEIDEIDIDDMTVIVANYHWVKSQPSKQYKHELLGMRMKSLNKLCLYEYIDLDYFFNQNYLTNLHKICAILYRKSKENEWGEQVMEPYEYDLKARAELFLDLPITDVYGIVAEFLKFRDNFLDVYANLFGEGESELSEKDKEDMDPDEIKEIEAEVKNSKWSWERMIYGLTNGDITKSSAVGDLSLTYVFNMLGMKKELDI